MGIFMKKVFISLIKKLLTNDASELLCFMPNKQSTALDALWKKLQGGPRNVTAYMIASLVSSGDIESAKHEYRMDGDKIAQVYLPLVKEILGCRIHQKHNCDHFFCSK